jgi:hypothetical protein
MLLMQPPPLLSSSKLPLCYECQQNTLLSKYRRLCLKLLLITSSLSYCLYHKEERATSEDLSKSDAFSPLPEIKTEYQAPSRFLWHACERGEKFTEF